MNLHPPGKMPSFILTDEQVRSIQAVAWAMYLEIHGILKRHEIRHFLAWGTLLGALRHRDFIPWDDDLDLCIWHEDYVRAVDVLKKELPSWCVVQDAQTDPGYFRPYAKVRDLRSETSSKEWPQYDKLKYRGICVDLFRAWNEWRSPFLRRYEYEKGCAKQWWTRMKKGERGAEAKLKMALHVGLALLLFPLWRTFRWQIAVMDPKDNGCRCFGTCFFPVREVEFHGQDCPVPYRAERLLRHLFGDWHQLPPPEKRKAHFAGIRFMEKPKDGSSRGAS